MAQNAGGLVIDVSALNTIHSIDPVTATVVVDAGVSLDSLMKAALPYGLWVPVLPGTRQVTLGGAIGCDVHGKNHHSAGSFGDHVLALDLLVADGRVLTLAPGGSPDDPGATLFWATVGGIGLTGVILQVTLRMVRVETAYFLADVFRTKNLDETIAAHLDGAERLRLQLRLVRRDLGLAQAGTGHDFQRKPHHARGTPGVRPGSRR